MSTATTPPVSTPAGSLVKVAKAGDSLFGKIFTVLKEDAEWIIAEVKTEVGVIEAYFEKKHVNAVVGTGTTTVAKAQVIASTAALEAAPLPNPAAPAPVAHEVSQTAAPSAPEETPEQPAP